MEFQTTITTPLNKVEVVIKTMLTGAEQEAVDGAELKFATTKDFKTFQAKESNLLKVTNAKKHELLARSVVTINGDATNPVERLQKMPAKDYNFVLKSIKAEQKKMMSETGDDT